MKLYSASFHSEDWNSPEEVGREENIYRMYYTVHRWLPVADPGFPRGGGANPKGGDANLLFGQFFPKTA